MAIETDRLARLKSDLPYSDAFVLGQESGVYAAVELPFLELA